MMSAQRNTWERLADSTVADRRTILKTFAAASVAGAFGVRHAAARQDAGTVQGDLPKSATAETEPEGGPEALAALLGFVPLSMAESPSGGIGWYYADIAQQFASLNLHHDADGPAWEDEPWLLGTLALALGSSVFQYTFNEDLIASIGFQPLGVDQTLLAGEPPEQLTLFRGEFDPARLQAAWASSGYERKESASGLPVWTIGEDGEFEITHPVQGVVFAAFNNVALLDDGVLAYAATMALLEDAIAVSESGAGSILDDPIVAAALPTLPATTVSAMSSGPIVLDEATIGFLEEGQADAIRQGLADSDDEVGPMPANQGALFGVSAGAVLIDEETTDAPFDAPDFAAGEGLALVRLVMASEADAEQAVQVVDYRLGELDSLYTGAPYTELLTVESSSAMGEVAAFDLAQVRSPAVWRNMVLTRDLLPFVPSVGE